MLGPIVALALLPAALATLGAITSAIVLPVVFVLWLIGLHGLIVIAVFGAGIMLAAFAPSDGARPPARPAPTETMMRRPDNRAVGGLRADPRARW